MRWGKFNSGVSIRRIGFSVCAFIVPALSQGQNSIQSHSRSACAFLIDRNAGPISRQQQVGEAVSATKLISLISEFFGVMDFEKIRLQGGRLLGLRAQETSCRIKGELTERKNEHRHFNLKLETHPADRRIVNTSNTMHKTFYLDPKMQFRILKFRRDSFGIQSLEVDAQARDHSGQISNQKLFLNRSSIGVILFRLIQGTSNDQTNRLDCQF